MLRKLSVNQNRFKGISNGERSQMSIQKPSIVNIPRVSSVGQILHNATSTRIHQTLKDTFDVVDPSLLYQITLLSNPVIRKRHIVVKNMAYIISNWTSDEFPNVIYVCLDSFTQGYQQYDYVLNVLTPTSKIAALELDQITSTMDQSAVRTYELKYTIRDCVTWQLPVQLLMMKFRIQIDESATPQILPLPNPFVFNVEIREDK